MAIVRNPYTEVTGAKDHFTDWLKDGTDPNIHDSAGGTPASPDKFIYAPASNEVAHVTMLRMIIARSGQFVPGDFGVGGPLTNGMVFRIVDDAGREQKPFLNSGTTEVPIKTNLDVSRFGTDLDARGMITGLLNNGEQFIISQWASRQLDERIRLDGSKGERVELWVQDTMTGFNLRTLRVRVYGWLE